MRRFFFEPQQEAGDRILITGPEARHINTVLRMQPGNEVELFDGRGTIVRGEIIQVNSSEVLVRTLSRLNQQAVHAPLTLVQAMLKGKKMDLLVQKATELGVDTFTPVVSRYCEKRSSGERLLDRWQRIMLEACKQCRRPIPMQVNLPVSLDRLSLTENSNLLMPWEQEESQPLSPALFNNSRSTVLLIGPEGGFHPTEVSLIRDRGFSTVSLGQRILRAETAAIAAVSIVQHLTHNLDPCRLQATDQD